MKLSKAEREVLEAGKEALSERRRIDETQRKQVESFMARRQGAASKFKQKLFDQALRAAGINVEVLAKRQARDRESVAKFLETQRQKALVQASTVNKRQEAKVAEWKVRWNQVIRTEAGAFPAPIITYVESATEIVLSGEGESSIAPDQNLAHTKAEVSSGGYLGGPLKGDLVNIGWHFLWIPPRNGLLSALTFLQMNGRSFMAINSDCNGGSASCSISAAIMLTQLDTQGNPHSDSQYVNLLDEWVQNSGWDSVGAVGGGHLDESDPVVYGPYLFPAFEQIPLLITVSATLYVLVRNAYAVLDFLSGDQRLNVPFVFLNLAPYF